MNSYKLYKTDLLKSIKIIIYNSIIFIYDFNAFIMNIV